MMLKLMLKYIICKTYMCQYDYSISVLTIKQIILNFIYCYFNNLYINSKLIMKNYLTTIVCVFYLFTNKSINAINILILEELASPSHNIWLNPVLTTLSEKGYNVTALTSNPNIKSTKSINSNLHYIYLDAVYETLYNTSKYNFDYLEIGKRNEFLQIFIYYEYAFGCCEGAIKSNGWNVLLNYPDNFKFDLVLHDYPGGSCLLGFLHKFHYPPLISITAFNDIFLTSTMTNNVLVPSVATHFVFKTLKFDRFLERLENYLLQIFDYFLREYYFYPFENKLLKTAMPNTPDIKELNRHSKLILINTHPAIDMIEFYPSNIIGVGGLHIKQGQPLPMDIQNIMDSAENGLILFSLGTNFRIDTLGTDKLQNILDAFEKLSSYVFLWKIETENFTMSIPKNVHIQKWIPQNDILAHPKTKLFITHAGLLSTQESTWHGVPMLGLPIFVDQFMNIEKSVRSGVAESLFINDLTQDNFIETILKLLNTPSYRENMKIRSHNFRDQKETPLERAIWWIEWVLRHPNATHLRSPGLDMNFVQRQSIDVIAFLTLALFSVILVKIYFIMKILRCLCCNRKELSLSKRKHE